MKKILLLLTVFSLGFVLSACDFGGTDPVVCDEGYELVGENCELIEVECADDEWEDPATGECEDVPTCTDDETYNAETNECDTVVVECTDDEWEDPSTGECEDVPTCTDDQEYNAETNECDDIAPALTLDIAGIDNVEVDAGATVDVLDGVTVTGSDSADYTSSLTADSDDCTIGEDGTITSDTPNLCTVTYSVVVAGVLARETRTFKWNPVDVDFPSDAPVVLFWDFEDAADLNGWSKYEAGGGSVVESIADGVLVLDTTSGGQVYETRFEYMGVPLEKDQLYRVSFMAKASVDYKVINLQFGELLPSDPWFTDFKPGYTVHIELTDEWTYYEFIFEHTIDNSRGGPLFEMGNIAIDAEHDHLDSTGIDAIIYIDDLLIEGGTGMDTTAPALAGVEDVIVEKDSVFDPLAGVTAVDFVDGDLTANIVVTGDTVDTATPGDYMVTYTITDAAGNEASVTRKITVIGIILDEDNDALLDEAFMLDNGWGYWYADWNSTSVMVSFDSAAAVFDIADTGDANWNIQLFQEGLTLVDGKTYRVTFDAMSTVGRDIRVKLIAADGAELEGDVTLTDAMQTFTVDFTYAGAEQGGKVDFELGFIGEFNEAHVVTIDNVMVEEFDGAAVVAETDQIMNGTFELPSVAIGFEEGMGWYNTIVWGQPIFDATFTPDGLIINNFKDGDNDFGTNYWDSIVRFYGLTLIEGGTYTVRFNAMSSVVDGSNIMFKMETSAFAAEQVFLIDDEEMMYEFTFEYTGATSNTAALLFFIGGTEHTITITNIDFYVDVETAGQTNAPEISGIEDMVIAVGSEFDPLEGVTVIDVEDGEIVLDASNVTVLGPNDETELDTSVLGDWVVTYTVVDADGNETVLVVTITVEEDLTYFPFDVVANGTFDANDLTGWTSWSADWFDPAIGGVLSADADMLVFTYDLPGDASWNHQINYEGINFEYGETYRIVFDAKGDVERDFQVNVWDGSMGHESGALALTTEMMTYSHTFVYMGGETAKIEFQLGALTENSAGTTFYLDNVMVYHGAEPVFADSMLLPNGTFDANDLTGWSSWSADWFDPALGGALSADMDMLVFNYDLPGDASWNHQINFDGISFEYGATYKLIFDAKGDVARDFQVNIWDGSMGHESGPLALTTEMMTYEHTFVYMGGATAKVEVQLGALTENSAGTVFYMDNVQLLKAYEPMLEDTGAITNGTFDANDLTGWTSWSADWFDPALGGVLSADMDMLVFTYDLPGDASWNHQINFDGISFEYGATYVLTFDAKGDAARDFQANVWDGSMGHESGPLALTTDMMSYEHKFVYMGGETAKVEFQLGMVTENSAGTMFYLDNVVLYKVVPKGMEEPLVCDEGFEPVDGVCTEIVVTDWTGYGMDVTVDGEVETIAYAGITGNWWEKNAQLTIDAFDGTNNAITFTFTGTAGHDYLFKIEGGGQFVEAAITADGTEQTHTLDLSLLTEEQRNALNLVIFFVQTEAAEGSAVVTWAYDNVAGPTTDWIGYGMDVTLSGEVETIAYDGITANWWDKNAQQAITFDGTNTAIVFTFTGTAGHDYLFKIEGGGQAAELGITADGTEQTLTIDLSGMTLEQRNALVLLVFFCQTETATGSAVVDWGYPTP